MELGLRLGDGPPFGFHQKPPSDPTVSHRGLDFCLSFSSISPLEQDEQTRHTQKRNELHKNDVVGRFSSPPPPPPPLGLQLDLLPRTPVVASHRSSQTDHSEDAAVFTATAEEGGGESPRNPILCSSLELEFRKYGGGAAVAAGGCGLVEMEDGNSERGWWRGGSDEEDHQNLGSRKKLRLSREQSAFLEESFKEHHTLYPKQKLELARRLNLRPRQVEVWFQNRRARTKLKQTEVDCEYLKKCCETLTQQNRKLQKELQDLRALKTTDSLFMHSPATTLTMCASCERAAACGGKEPVNSKASGFSSTRTGPFPFSPTDPTREKN